MNLNLSGQQGGTLHLAADADYFYWAIRSVTDPRMVLYQLQIYNSFNDAGKNNAALLLMVRRGRQAEVKFDYWKNDSKSRFYTEGIDFASGDTFFEMRVPRKYIDLKEFQLNLVGGNQENGKNSRLVENFFVRLP